MALELAWLHRHAHETERQFARVPSKSIVACVPSQNGLFDECPQRHIDIGSGWSITRPSGAVSATGPETMYGPSSLGVMVTSDTGVTFFRRS